MFDKRILIEHGIKKKFLSNKIFLFLYTTYHHTCNVFILILFMNELRVEVLVTFVR